MADLSTQDLNAAALELANAARDQADIQTRLAAIASLKNTATSVRRDLEPVARSLQAKRALASKKRAELDALRRTA